MVTSESVKEIQKQKQATRDERKLSVRYLGEPWGGGGGGGWVAKN